VWGPSLVKRRETAATVVESAVLPSAIVRRREAGVKGSPKDRACWELTTEAWAPVSMITFKVCPLGITAVVQKF